MNIQEIKELLELIEEAAIEEFEMERSGVRIRIRKSGPTPPNPLPAATEVSQPTRPQVETQAEEPAEQQEVLHLFKAPIVGTFYSATKPDAEPFVHPGDSVQKGTVLCIIEAMKLLNQIESDVDGEVTGILVENGQPVEYGEPLFEIRPRPMQ